MQEKAACIVTGGTLEEEFLLEHLEGHAYAMVIAVDGALESFARLNRTPDCAVGDFDTVSCETLAGCTGCRIIRHPAEKDQTDTELAIEVAREEGCTRMSFLGAAGSRLDHSLANIFLLQRLAECGLDGTIYDRYNKLYLRTKSFTVTRKDLYGDYFSLLPLTETVTGVTLTGVKYPVRDRIFDRASTLGVSNEVVDDEASITFSEGMFLVVEASDRERKRKL